MEISSTTAKVGAGVTALIATGTTTTAIAKTQSQKESFGKNDSSTSQMSYGFGSFFSDNKTIDEALLLHKITAENYESMDTKEKEWWKKRFEDYKKNNSKIRSYRFKSIIKDQNVKGLFNECKKVSSLSFNNKSDDNYWEKYEESVLNNPKIDTKEKKARYWRDVWVGCSEKGSSVNINSEWPHRDEIKEHNESTWNNKPEK
ncbi:hypothetical protein MHSWG343_05870 [Candidatus Mycoplasma haematohominis]|uniref:Uncharacterized protein n=1 Tax=Candidatus Mycoplasma haematohominis TaxID=1494318 RepID=A0A478FU73_9MOLU|nr:hypothetical protein MHSWG343_05870 [Candidatus Mycoplasma haemohominis]